MDKVNKEYYQKLETRFKKLVDNLDKRVNDVVEGRVTPALDDIKIGSGRSVTASVLFFDIVNFSKRTSNEDVIKETLVMLNAVIPMMMYIVYDYNGYVEKNTGDGIMGIIGVEEDEVDSCESALNAAIMMIFCLKEIINPFLMKKNITKVEARIGIDYGRIIISRIGLPKGSSKNQRSFITAVGTTANIANKIQGLAGINEIWAGNNVYNFSTGIEQLLYFKDVTPIDGSWSWVFSKSKDTYKVYKYTKKIKNPPSLSLLDILKR